MGVTKVGVIAFDSVSVGAMVTISDWVGLPGKVSVATGLSGFWPVVGVGRADLPGRLHAERTATSARDNDKNLNVFNFAFLTAMKI
jgi:hypothetical protein